MAEIVPKATGGPDAVRVGDLGMGDLGVGDLAAAGRIRRFEPTAVTGTP